MRLILPGRRQERPAPSRVAPVAYRDAVELYARKSGRHADIVWVDAIGCWQIRFTLRSADPVLGLVQSGRSAEQVETVELTKPGFITSLKTGQPMPYNVPMELDDLGVEGLKEWLEVNDTWSGRGKFNSLEEAARKTREANEANRDKQKADAKDDAIQFGREVRRQVCDVPLLPVGIDLNT